MKKAINIFRFLFFVIIGFYSCVGVILFLYMPPRPKEKLKEKLLPVPIYDQTLSLEKSKLDFRFLDLKRNQNFNLNDKIDTILFVNFWATWCKPCVAEIPSMNMLQQKIKDYPVKFLLVSDEPKKKVIDFYTRKKYSSLNFCVSNEKIPEILEGNSLPRTYIIYKDKIIYEHIGAANWDSEDIINMIKKQLD